MENTILDAGIEIILLLQGLGSWLVAPMAIFTFLGNQEFYLLALVGIYWAINSRAGLRLGLALLLSGAINYLFKLVLHSPRPYWYDERVIAWSAEASFGVPSGHAQNAVVLWSVLAGYVRKFWAWGGALLLIFLIGVSRMYLGVHFPHDVIFGWLTGAVLMLIILGFEKGSGSWFARHTRAAQYLLAFAASVAILAAAFLVRLALGEWTLPEVWIQAASAAAPDAHPLDPLNIANAIAGGGAFFGLAAGAIWLDGRGGYSAGGPAWQRAVRLPLGLAGAALLYLGPGSLLEGRTFMLAPILQYFLYALLGLWVAGLAPAMFMRLGIASAPPPKASRNIEE